MELKMMSGGGQVDLDGLTAAPDDVVENRIFYGTGSDERQTGRLPDMGRIRSSPGLSQEEPDIPLHSAGDVLITTDTYGIRRVALAPPRGKYPGNTGAYVGCTPEELGAAAELIRNENTVCGIEGTYGSDGNIEEDDVAEGKVGYNAQGRMIGSRKKYGTVNKTLAAGETYEIKKGMYDGGIIAAQTLAAQTAGTAANDDIIKNKTAVVNGAVVTGSMPELTDDAAITYSSSDTRKVIVGDACYQVKNSDGTERLLIRYGGAKGRIKPSTMFAIPLNLLRAAIKYTDASKVLAGTTIAGQTGTMVDRGEVTKVLDPGGSYTIPKGYHNGSGKVTAKKRNVKQLNADAIRGFGMSSSDYVTSESESFTMPEAGTVYYGGFSASYNAGGTVTCEIYKNNSLIDNRNINSSNKYVYRGTMVRKSFSAAKGDVIKVSATATSGSHSMAHIDATIVWFQ